MNLKIPDHLDSKQRKKFLEIYPIIYAFWKFKGNMKKMADFLDLSTKCLAEKMSLHDELKHLSWPELKIDLPAEDNKSDPIFKIYRYHLERSKKTFWWATLTLDEQKKAAEKIRQLYYVTHDEQFKLK